MGAWSANSKSHVATMDTGDFHHNEKSTCVANATAVKIELFGKDGSTTTLKEKVSLLDKEVIDATVMSKSTFSLFGKRDSGCKGTRNFTFSTHESYHDEGF